MHAARPGRRGAGGGGMQAALDRGEVLLILPQNLPLGGLCSWAQMGGAPREPPNYRAWYLQMGTLDLPWPFRPPSPRGPLLRCEPRLPSLTDGFP